MKPSEPLITNERGAREWQWLCEQVGETTARATIGKLKGGQRAYPLNIARKLDVQLPPDAELPALKSGTEREKAHTKIAEIRAMLR